MVTDLVSVPPALVAVQLTVWPAAGVSWVMLVVVSQAADLLVMADWASVTVQLTETSSLYQPLALGDAGVTFGVMTGGVLSAGAAVLNVQVLFCASALPARSLTPVV